MAYLKNWTDNFLQIFFMGTSWVAISINNIKTRASREMTSRTNIKIIDLNGMNVASTGMWRGEVFAISDCLVYISIDQQIYYIFFYIVAIGRCYIYIRLLRLGIRY